MIHIPLSTYRVQVNKYFTFYQVEELVPYFKKLGIKEIYLSPILQAQSGSLHGYDTIEYGQINKELGGIDGLKKLSNKLQENHMGLCIDIVPNHMAATKSNIYWQDVLKKHKSSVYSNLFDVKWENSTEKELMYRRFFDINELICLKTEDEIVFNFVHELIIKLIKDKTITGLRIDHIDGLREPFLYLKKLNETINFPFYIIAEKILGYNETLSKNWPLLGTTGYDFLNELNQIFVNKKGLTRLNDYYNHVSNNHNTIEEIKVESLKLVIQTLFKKEFSLLCKQLEELLNEDVYELLLNFSSFMPVYRIYQRKGDIQFNKKIINYIVTLMSDFQNNALLFLFKSLLLNKYPLDFDQEKIKKWNQWRNDWEVFTGPVMAKGFEDTTCYNYYAFLAVNEVGSAPQYFTFGGNINKFHRYNEYKQKNWPFSLNTTSTHDTKRSEDVRARLNVLTEVADEWNSLLDEWQILNKDKKILIQGKLCPDTPDELLIYQTLLGVLPIATQERMKKHLKKRMEIFLIKAIRERKKFSSWKKPNESYEKHAVNFMKLILNDMRFLSSFLIFHKKIAFWGMLNSLSQLVLKMTCPGIPDFFQGNELWCFNLVDPDNRSVINYNSLQALDSEECLPSLLINWKNGQIKFNLIKHILYIRNQFPDIFLYGSYIPLKIQGNKPKNIIAFARKYKEQMLVIIICRWFSELTGCADTWTSDIFSNETICLSGKFISIFSEKVEIINKKLLIKDLLRELPFCLLKNIE